MDSFAEPYTRLGDDISLDEVRAQVRALEADHRAAGIPLSGRVLHVCHYLPVTATLNRASGVLSPPATPPVKPVSVAGEAPPTPPAEVAIKVNGGDGDGDAVWTLVPRYGHAAMISGIRSLAATHEQLIIGWTGDIQAATPNAQGEQVHNIPTKSISEEHRAALQGRAEHVPAQGERPRRRPEDDPLWPLFHYLLWQDIASEDVSQDAHYAAYAAANKAFAERIAAVYQPGDLIWVHDYHLLLVPKLVRGARARFSDRAVVVRPDHRMLRGCRPASVRSGVVSRAPVHWRLPVFPFTGASRLLSTSYLFPPPNNILDANSITGRKEILDGMVGADLVCFQTYSYSRHFTSTCIRVCGYETTPRGIDAEGHVTAVTHCPVGVDAERVGRDILRPGITPKLEALRALYEGKKIIVGRDKLDVVKGVLQKVGVFQKLQPVGQWCRVFVQRSAGSDGGGSKPFQKLLQTYPEWIGNVVLIQVTSPSLTDSPKLERQVSELVANINGEFGSLDFVPVHHYHQTLKKDEFYALLSVADLAVITPLRDGMNTTSMEFVIAQGKTKKSPVVLSEFMGISKHMEKALMDVAAAINTGLLMSESEKLARHVQLHKVVTTHTSHTWAAVLVKMLLGQLGGKETARRTPYIPRDVLESRYHAAKKRLFFFDYDGTLAPIVKTPSMAVPSAAALKALERLSADPRNVVYIISGRDGGFLEQHLGHLKNVGFSAEHGGFMRPPGSADKNGEGGWVNLTEKLDMSWMGEVEEVFRYYTERTTGSHVEMKKSSITWHYRGSDPEWGLFQCRQCQDLLENNLAHKRPIEVLVGKKNLEVRPIAVNKGEIVKRLLYQNPDAEFIFCAGDDKTDEDMFRALILFGTGATKATMEAPLSVTLLDADTTAPVELAIKPDCVFTTAVGHSSKRTLASWHVTAPQEIIDHMLGLVGDADAQSHL
ncbi:Trehalose-6-phosphate phosphatase [Mycena venus]|uniref:Trehalose-6-phosphate phosphatase n=1 Tax=Mycena venus TaxID=2733690 RepID=A0A8H6WPY7_9AGAR|nr:Trehalose-6-phosphate phosphatase [Mycena venus]